jgi:uncharacterized protein (DUF4213/DUF364 family)
MSILDELMSMLKQDAPVRDIRQGVFHTGVLTRNCGLAATLPKDALRQKPPLVQTPGFLLEKSALNLTQMASSDSILEAAIGMAAINSLLDIDTENCLELNARDLIADKGKGKRIAMVGHFPFIPKLRELAKELWVFEKNPQAGDLTEADAENLIPKADVVCITGTAITNHTLDHLLGLCSAGAYVVLLGDTAPLSPIFFDHGIDAVCGTVVINNTLALRCISEGANFRQIKGTRRLAMIK